MADQFHPELTTVARFLPRRPVRPRTVPILRRLMQGMERRTPEGVQLCGTGDVSVRLHLPPDPEGAPHPAILWIHGGGFLIGSPAQDDRLCRRLSRELGAVVAAVKYRLAPQHPFPIPLHDCHDALAWLAARDDVDSDRVAVGGASAGGGLAAGLALLARDRAEVTLAAQVLAYPMLDDRTALRTDIDERRLRLWDNRSNRLGWSSYTASRPGAAGTSPLAAPARHEDLRGLPPAWVGVGTLDLFHDEDVAYARRLRDAGVPCDLEVVDGAFHAFDGAARHTSVARAFVAAQTRAFATAFAG